jgi:hypothetical protein
MLMKVTNEVGRVTQFPASALFYLEEKKTTQISKSRQSKKEGPIPYFANLPSNTLLSSHEFYESIGWSSVSPRRQIKCIIQMSSLF